MCYKTVMYVVTNPLNKCPKIGICISIGIKCIQSLKTKLEIEYIFFSAEFHLVKLIYFKHKESVNKM